MNILGNRVPFQARAMQLPTAPAEEQPKVEETAVEEQAPAAEEKTEEAPAQAVETVGTPSYLAQRGIKIVSPAPTRTPALETPTTETHVIETPVEEPEAPIADADEGGSSHPNLFDACGTAIKNPSLRLRLYWQFEKNMDRILDQLHTLFRSEPTKSEPTNSESTNNEHTNNEPTTLDNRTQSE